MADLRAPADTSGFRQAAERGDAIAQARLGLAYFRGDSVERDLGQAAHWFRAAAEQGEPSAQFNLGLLHLEGTSVPQDHTEAAKWFRAAAENRATLVPKTTWR